MVIEHSDLTTKVYQWLKDRILHHAFLPGDKLDVQQLADDLGVSRTPVKDAINRLTAEGLVVLRSRRGTYVATLTPTTLRDLFGSRMMIEAWSAQQLALAAMTGAAAAMQTLLDRSTAIIAGATPDHFDHPAFHLLDLALHERVVSLTRNAVVLDIHRVVMARMRVGRIYFPGEDEIFRRSLGAHEEHTAIVRAFVQGNGDALVDAVRAHISASQRHTAWLVDRFAQARDARQERPQVEDRAPSGIAANL